MVASLKHLLPIPESALIFKGAVLSDDHAIEFYHVNMNDAIVAIPLAAISRIGRRWMILTEDADSFADSVNVMIHPVSTMELLRLQDLMFAKRELRSGRFRRWMAHQTVTCGSVVPAQIYSTIVPAAATELSTSPLPVCWGREPSGMPVIR
jgi:hypothetical protein